MVYNVGDVLRCKKEVNSKELEMCNMNLVILPGDKFVIIDKDNYPDENPSHCYVLKKIFKKETVVIDAWNDEGHMILDDRFEVVA